MRFFSNSKNQRQAGFTLLELMVVMFIISIAFGLVALSVGGMRFSSVKQEVERLLAFTQVASEDAVLEGQILGLRFEKEGESFVYMWLIQTNNQIWQSYRNSVLDVQKFDEELQLSLKIEGQEIDWQNKPEQDELTGELKRTPHIVFLPGGDQTAFELLIEDPLDKQSWKLIGNSVGQVELEYEAYE